MDLELKLLRAFLAIYDAASVSVAADRMGVTQPTMSAHLRRLRDTFGDPLFHYQARRLQPTAKARALYPTISTLIAGFDQLAEHLDWSPRASDRLFTLGASGYVQQLLLPALDRRLRNGGPGLRLRMVAGLAKDQVVDAIVAPREAIAPELTSRALFDERLVCLFDGGSFKDSTHLTLDRFCALDHILVAPAPSPPHDAVDRALHKLGRARRVAYVVESDTHLAPLLMGQARLAMLPERAARRYGVPLRVADAPVPLRPVTFAIAWRKASDGDVANRWFRQQVVAAARDCALTTS